MFIVIRQSSRKSDPKQMIRDTNNFVIFLIDQTWDSSDTRPWQFLNKNDVKLFFVF